MKLPQKEYFTDRVLFHCRIRNHDGDVSFVQRPNQVGPHVVANHDDRSRLNDVDKVVHLPVGVKREV